MAGPVVIHSAFSEWILDPDRLSMRKETRFWRYQQAMRKSLVKPYLLTAAFGLIIALPGLVVFAGQNFLALAELGMWKQFYFALGGLILSVLAFILLLGWPLLHALRAKTLVLPGPEHLIVGKRMFYAAEGAKMIYSVGRSGRHTLGVLKVQSPRQYALIAIVAGDQIGLLGAFAAKLSAAAQLPYIEEKNR